MRRGAARSLLLALLLSASSPAPVGGAEAEPATFEVATDPATVVVLFSETHGEVGEADAGSSLRVYGDGRVVVHHPRYMRRAGDFTLQLSRAEMRLLLASLVGRGVVEFDEAATRREKREVDASLRAQRSELFAVADPSVTTVEIRLRRYAPGGAGGEARDVERRIRWRGLRSDARRYPAIRAIQDLAAVQRELRALMDREDLVRIPGGAP
jgi:hypothetical protein